VEYEGIPHIAKLINNPHQVIQRLSLKLLSLTSHMHKVKLICRDFLVRSTVLDLPHAFSAFGIPIGKYFKLIDVL
jgi:hypothetical protein